MTKRMSGTLAVAVGMVVAGLTWPAGALAQLPGCGSRTTSLDMRQAPNYARYVEVVAVTSRSWNLCPITLQTEAWVNGVSGAGYATGTYHAELRLGRPVAYYGTWHSTSRHWAIFTGLYWEYHGMRFASTPVVPPPVQPSSQCELIGSECPEGTVWSGALCACKTSSPILVDVAGDGYTLTDSDSGVHFDLDANGVAERIAWSPPGSDDGWLVLDRNGNGRVDDGSELFGTSTPMYVGARDPVAENGFIALKMLEHPEHGAGVADGVIDAKDAIYAKLRLWIDQDGDGVSRPEELVPLDEVGLLALETTYKESRRRDRHGNVFAYRADSTWEAEGGGTERRAVFDVFLTVQGAPARRGRAGLQGAVDRPE